MLTFLPLEEIDAMDKWEGAQLNTAKEILAYELTKLVHGEEEATKAQASARAVFGGGADIADMPTEEITSSDLTNGEIDIVSLLVKSGLCASKSEARRTVEQGGASVDGNKVSDIKATFNETSLKDGIVLRRGKKNYKKIILK